MTKMTRDIPNHEGMTLADRLKAARQDAELTRKALADATGIPSSTLEKYERGDMDPNTTRLQTLCDHLDVSVNWVLYGDDAPGGFENTPLRENQPSENVAATVKPAETLPSAKIAETSTVVPKTASPAKRKAPLEQSRRMLSDLDNMRADDFNDVQRGTMALVNDVQATLKSLEPSELLTLAQERELFQNENYLDAPGILELLSNRHDDGEAYCNNFAERILDTAILGVDLFSIDHRPLVGIASDFEEKHDIESTKIFGWGNHPDFVPLIRPHLWAMAIYSEGYNFEDHEVFPRLGQSPDNESRELSGIGMF